MKQLSFEEKSLLRQKLNRSTLKQTIRKDTKNIQLPATDEELQKREQLKEKMKKRIMRCHMIFDEDRIPLGSGSIDKKNKVTENLKPVKAPKLQEEEGGE